MKLKELYKKVRKEQEVILDEDAMWDAIESRLEQPNKKRRFIWLWFTMGISLMSAIIYLNLDFRSIQKENIASEKITQNTTLPMNKTPIMTPHELDINTLKSYSKGEPLLAGTEVLENNKLSRNTNLGSISYSYEERIQNYKESPHINISRTERKNNYVISSDSVADSAFNSIKDNRISSSELMHPIQNLVINPLPSRTLTIIENENYSIEFDRLPLTSPMNDYLFTDTSQQRKWQFELSGSLDYLNARSTVMEKDQFVDTWGDLHDQSKSASSSFQLNSLLKYRHTSGFGIGSGIVVRLVSEWYDTTIEEISPIETLSDSAKYAIINGIQQFTAGVLNGTQTDRTNYHTPVRRLYFDIPVELSYNRVIGSFNFEVLLSYNLNVHHQYYGRSYSDGQVFLDQNQLILSGIYKNRFVNSTNVGLNINRYLTSGVSAGLSLNYWHQLSSSLDGNSSVQEYYNGLGVGLSLKRKFN